MAYKREELSKCCLFTLRQIGREIGVKSPTSLTKNALIEQIIKVDNGEIKPYFSKVGRKHLNDEYDKIIEKKNDREEFLLELEKLTLEYREKITKLYNKYALDK